MILIVLNLGVLKIQKFEVMDYLSDLKKVYGKDLKELLKMQLSECFINL